MNKSKHTPTPKEKTMKPAATPEIDGEIRVALDVGTTKVIAVAGRLNQNGKIEVVDFSVLANTGMVRGEIFNSQETTYAIAHVKEELEQKIGRPINEVTVGISGDHIRTFYTREYLTRRNPKELIDASELKMLEDLVRENIVINDDEEILDVIPQSLWVEHQPVYSPMIGTMGKRLEAGYMVIVGRMDKIEKLENSIQRAGLKIDDIILQPIASARAVINNSQCKLGVVMVDIGGGTSDILVCNQGKVRFAGVIPYGGDYITSEIFHRLKLTDEMAEYLKVKHGSVMLDSAGKAQVLRLPLKWTSKPLQIKRELLSDVIRYKMDIVINEIDRMLYEYQKQFPAEELKVGMVITGGGSQLKNLIQYLQYKLGMEVQLGDPRHLLSPDPRIKFLFQPQYATVVGLLDIALHKIKIEPDKATVKNEPESDSVQDPEEGDTVVSGEGNEPENKQENRKRRKKGLSFSSITRYLKNIGEVVDKSND